MRKIIVGVDESAGAASALQWAVEEGAIRGWPVEAALAWGLLDQHHPKPETPFDPDYGAEDAREALAGYVEAAVGDAAVQRRVINDLPARGLLELVDVEEASLVVVGSRGFGGLRASVLGSVSYECVHRSTKPIVVVRDGMDHRRPGAARRVVVGIDGSPASLEALEWAVEAAVARRAELRVVHAWHLPYVGTDIYGGMLAVDPDTFEDVARKVVDDALAKVDTRGLDVPMTTCVVHDGAAPAVLAAAAEADLVVVGARGTGGFTGLLLGSASNQIVHHAPCPVVVVPAGR